MMQIIPEGLEIFDRRKYISDIAYRELCDHEKAGERRLRLALFFNPDIEADIAS